MFPADNIWHADVSGLPVHPKSSQYVSSIGSNAQAKADFGAGLWNGGPIGIPYNVVGAGQPTTAVTFGYDEDSDHVPYPIPANPSIEGGPNSNGDRHVLIVDNSSCTLYELYATYPNGNGTWHAGSGAVWNLTSNALRTDGYTSGDAAGLPILPGLVRYDEVASGRIDHAIRVTVPASDRSHLWPARHDAGSANSNLPPMGLRLRLKAQFDVSPYPHDDQVILQAMKTYGVIVADNGSPWYMTGVPDERWNNDVLQQLRNVRGSDFEAVDESGLMTNSSSGAALASAAPSPSAPLPVGDGPAATSASPGTEDVFARGFDDALWTRHRTGSGWGPWTSLGGIITTAPAASGNNIYARGGDNALWTRTLSTGWSSLGGIITTAPAASGSTIFARGADNALWTRTLSTGWTTLGGIITTGPAASGNDVYARGGDNALWTRSLSTGWSSLGGIITSPPAATGVDLFARGTDNALWTRTLSTGWSSLGGQIK